MPYPKPPQPRGLVGFLFVGSFSIFRHRTLCLEDKNKKLLILWYGVAASSFFPIFFGFELYVRPDVFLEFYFFWSFLNSKE